MKSLIIKDQTKERFDNMQFENKYRFKSQDDLLNFLLKFYVENSINDM